MPRERTIEPFATQRLGLFAELRDKVELLNGRLLPLRHAKTLCSCDAMRTIARSTDARCHTRPVITLYAFRSIFPEGIGETKDLRAQWVLEETGLPYRVHGLDHGAGDLDSDAYGRISPFHQVPVIDDDGFIVAESAAIALYVAEKAGKLIPADFHGRTRVVQWCFAAAATVAPTLQDLDLLGIFDSEKAAPKLHEGVDQLAHRWLKDVERRLDGRDWIATDEFSAADIMMAGVLRNIRNTELMTPYPRITAYYARCFARPAWQRTLAMYAERLGVAIDVVR